MSTVVTLANDRFVSWFLPFVESFRQYNPELPLAVIPFDDDMEIISKVASVYGYSIIHSDEQRKIDDISDILKPTSDPKDNRRRILRKLLIFQIENEFLYVDCDTLCFNDLTPMMGHVASDCALIFGNRSPGRIYKPSFLKELPDAAEFNAGVLASSSDVIPLSNVLQFIEGNIGLITEATNPRLMDQGLLNLYVDANRVPTRRFADFAECSNPVMSHRSSNISIRDNRLFHRKNGLPCSIVHWAGVSSPAGEDMIHRNVHSFYMARAMERLSSRGVSIPGLRAYSI